MSIHRILAILLGTLILLRAPRRDERGLSQSTENVILLVGAIAVAGAVIGLVLTYVNDNLKAGLLPWTAP